jgi:outer membrane protein OmpA-like peptidoglycan-associated protein
MKPTPTTLGLLALVATTALFLTACTSQPAKPAVSDARSRLTQLQGDPQLASRAPAAILEAETAVRAAEANRRNDEHGRHLAVIAGRKVDIATAQAHSKLLEDQRVALAEQRDRARLDARTREANLARSDANLARSDAADARSDADQARGDAALAAGAAALARDDADAARADADQARNETDDLQRLLAELNARPTERGMVVALGDVMFESGRSALRSGSEKNLAKLAAFLSANQDRAVYIEGHTDSVGSAESNLTLSQQRADAVRAYLIFHGAKSARLAASGLGEGSPIGDNATVAGREQNRRVEVIIANPTVASR